MSSKALRTVLLPEPERPVRITSWRASRLAAGFTGRCRSVFDPALMGARNAHVFAIFRNRSARDVDARVIEFFRDLIVSERPGSVLFFDHLLDQALQREQRHAAAFGAVHRFAEE